MSDHKTPFPIHPKSLSAGSMLRTPERPASAVELDHVERQLRELQKRQEFLQKQVAVDLRNAQTPSKQPFFPTPVREPSSPKPITVDPSPKPSPVREKSSIEELVMKLSEKVDSLASMVSGLTPVTHNHFQPPRTPSTTQQFMHQGASPRSSVPYRPSLSLGQTPNLFRTPMSPRSPVRSPSPSSPRVEEKTLHNLPADSAKVILSTGKVVNECCGKCGCCEKLNITENCVPKNDENVLICTTTLDFESTCGKCNCCQKIRGKPVEQYQTVFVRSPPGSPKNVSQGSHSQLDINEHINALLSGTPSRPSIKSPSRSRLSASTPSSSSSRRDAILDIASALSPKKGTPLDLKKQYEAKKDEEHELSFGSLNLAARPNSVISQMCGKCGCCSSLNITPDVVRSSSEQMNGFSLIVCDSTKSGLCCKSDGCRCCKLVDASDI